MIAGLSGSLLSHDALERLLPDVLHGLLDESGRHAARARIRGWHLPLRLELGPATSVRRCFDRLAAPLFAQLGYQVVPVAAHEHALRALLVAAGRPSATLLVTSWGQDPNRVWREAVHHGIAHSLTWCFCVTGPSICVIDARRTYSRRIAELALERALDDEQTFAVFWGLLRAAAMGPEGSDARPLLERAVQLSEEHRAMVRTSLQQGVHEALEHLLRAFAAAGNRPGRGTTLDALRASVDPRCAFDESLTIVYRILFLLFAEARGIVPRWHPVFRDSYTIESVRKPVLLLARPRGLWETLQAIARLAHRGCRVGALRVTAFNGRLFSPTQSPLSETLPLDDGEVRQALLALTTRPVAQGRVPITYGDLGVEQLGGVYERILDFEPARSIGRRKPALVRAGRRKATGSFYTPRTIADYVVRRALAPLVRDASPGRILGLRVLDPAMGSGAFLVSACRYLAGAYEAALLREGGLSSEDIDDAGRAGFRRAVAQNCLYGVDINPTAVQIGRLSLWLATMAADRPLTFLDHRLRSGNSLAGAFLADILRQPPGSKGRDRRPAVLPLFADDSFGDALSEAVGVRQQIAADPGDTLEQVRSKERALEDLSRNTTRLTQLKQVADLWCSGWFDDAPAGIALRKAFGTLADELLGRPKTLPAHSSAGLFDRACAIAADQRFFHWTFEFPEVFYDAAGHPLSDSGFDAIVGNPPWEMLRGDIGDTGARTAARSEGSRLTTFARRSGVYRYQREGHANLYQLFVERALMLLREGGRLGFVLPSGFAVDHGSAVLRRAVLESMSLDALVSIENRDGVFPIHRGLKFLLLSATKSAATKAIHCRFGIRSAAALDGLPDTGMDRDAVTLSLAFVEKCGGSGLAVPDIRTAKDLEIVTQIAFDAPALGDPDGWNIHFGRELNATEDRRHFVAADARGLPVVEGKQITPFVVDTAAVRYRIPRTVAARVVRGDRVLRARLAYRDVAASTNRVSLIAAIVPADCVTTHTVFCLKEALDERWQHYLCGMFNSFVANYLIRLRITTHVSAIVIDRLPVPKPPGRDALSTEVAALAAKLSARGDPAAFSRLQAAAARLYGLRLDQFEHILETFPLVPRRDRDDALMAFCDIFGRR